MIFRPATLSDLDSIVSLHIAAWQTAYRGIIPDPLLDSISPEKRRVNWTNAIQNPHRSNILALDNDHLLGFVSTAPSPDKDVDPSLTLELIGLYIHPNHWRHGIGKSLCSFALSSASSGKYSTCTLWVLEKNHRARQFYESQRFTLDPNHRRLTPWYGDTTAELRYRQSLSAIPAANPIKSS